jgi:hypothetical protein
MKPNQQLISLGESIHSAIKQFAHVRRHAVEKYTDPTFIYRNLRGACVPAAYLMSKEANKKGIGSHMLLGCEHAFVSHDGIIYDPTYCQYLMADGVAPRRLDVKLQVWDDVGNIPEKIRFKYNSSFHTTKESTSYIKRNFPGEQLDGYQVHWITPARAHISWSKKGTTINPIH